MGQHFQAIFEHGVLRPLEPLDLREQELVSVSIEKASGGAGSAPPEMMTANQRQAILDLLDEMERMPQKSPDDGFSQRDHDQLLYGPKQ